MLKTPQEYAELILAYNNGAPLRLKDVAEIVDGAENDYLIAWGLYAFAALGCLLVWCRLTRFMWRCTCTRSRG